MKVKISCSVCPEANFVVLEKDVVSEADFEGLLASVGHLDENCSVVGTLYDNAESPLYSREQTAPEPEPLPEDPAQANRPWWQFW